MESAAAQFMAQLNQYPVVVMTLVSLIAFCIMYTLGQLSESGAWRGSGCACGVVPRCRRVHVLMGKLHA